MTQEDLINELNLAQKDFEAQKEKIIIRYCAANNPYKIGDVFTDHIGSIRIEKMRAAQLNSQQQYCCVYTGVELKKDGTETKNKTVRSAWQVNEKKS